MNKRDIWLIVTQKRNDDDQEESKRLAGDIAREANSDEVKGLRREAAQLKEALAETVLENRLLKKALLGLARR